MTNGSVAMNSRPSHYIPNWGGWIRTTDLLINSQALCQLSYTPSTAWTAVS